MTLAVVGVLLVGGCCGYGYPGTGSGSCSLIVLAHSDLVKLVTFLTIEKNIPNNNSGFNKDLQGSPFAILAMFLFLFFFNSETKQFVTF